MVHLYRSTRHSTRAEFLPLTLCAIYPREARGARLAPVRRAGLQAGGAQFSLELFLSQVQTSGPIHVPGLVHANALTSQYKICKIPYGAQYNTSPGTKFSAGFLPNKRDTHNTKKFFGTISEDACATYGRGEDAPTIF